MIKKIFAGVAVLGATVGSAGAAQVVIAEIPLKWSLQNYLGDNTVVWFTGSPCTSGGLTLGPSATQGDKNRFWATISLAKTAGRKVFVFYEDSDAPLKCVITSFGLAEE